MKCVRRSLTVHEVRPRACFSKSVVTSVLVRSVFPSSFWSGMSSNSWVLVGSGPAQWFCIGTEVVWFGSRVVHL